MFRSDFIKKGVCSKSVTKTLYRNKSLVSECIFKLVCHYESCRHIRGVEMFVFRKIWRALFSWNTRFEIRPFALLPEKYLWNRLLLLLIFESSRQSCSVQKGVFKHFTGKPLYWRLFNRVQALRACNVGVFQRRCFPLTFANFLRTLIFKNTCVFIYNAWKSYSQRGIIRTLSNIYHGVYSRKQLKASSFWLFSEKKLHHRYLAWF